MNEMDLAFKKTFFLEASSLTSLEGLINYHQERGCWLIGSVFKDGDTYIQQMGKNASMAY